MQNINIFSISFPKYLKKLQECDSSVCCVSKAKVDKEVDPKCIVNIVRRSKKSQLPRDEYSSEEKNYYHRRKPECTFACTKSRDSGVQTEYRKNKRRGKLHPVDVEYSSDDVVGCNNR